MSFENTKQTIFTGTQLDYEEIVEIPEGYEKAELKDFEDGTLIRGRPEMASVSSFTFDDDGEEKTVNRFKLYIFQDALFDFLTSILELENAGSVGKSNILRNVDLSEYREFVNRLSEMTIQVKERSGTYTFYSFIVRDVQV